MHASTTPSARILAARRTAEIEPLQVMEVLARAQALEAAGRRVLHMEIGEPDFTAPQGVVEAGVRALRSGLTAYTATLGLPALLSNDVQRNLEAPLAELRTYAAARGVTLPEMRVAVRTGDTPPAERGRKALAQVGTVIVDEIHALAGDKRGAHLALSLERLDRLETNETGRAPVRVGLSATQRPIERVDVTRFKVLGASPSGARRVVSVEGVLPYQPDAALCVRTDVGGETAQEISG